MKGLMRLVLFLLLFSPAGAMAASGMFVQVEMFPKAKNYPVYVDVIEADALFATIQKETSISQLFKGNQRPKREEVDAGIIRSGAVDFANDYISYALFARNFRGEAEFPYLLFFKLDGVSNFLYNLAYIISIPDKFFSAIGNYSDMSDMGASDIGALYFLWVIYQLVLGFFLALFCGTFGTIVSIIVHPLYTLSNLTIHLFGTLFDLFWGALLQPLVSMVFSFFGMFF